MVDRVSKWSREYSGNTLPPYLLHSLNDLTFLVVVSTPIHLFSIVSFSIDCNYIL